MQEKFVEIQKLLKSIALVALNKENAVSQILERGEWHGGDEDLLMYDAQILRAMAMNLVDKVEEIKNKGE
jgi:hypothetical protein